MNLPEEPTPPTGAPQPDPPAPAPEAATETGLGIAQIQQYVWSRYVKFEEAPFEIDEAQALRVLEDHYRTHSLTTDSECFYYGILAYEQAFSQPDPTPLLRKALAAFLSYRGQISSDFSFEAVDDRYTDALETLGLGGGKKADA
jgi:hypothetical protein